MITTSVIFHMLSKEHEIEVNENAADRPVRLARLYTDAPLEPEYLYIADSSDKLPDEEQLYRFSLLLLNFPKQERKSSYNLRNAAFVAADMTKTELLQRVTETFIRIHEWDAKLGKAYRAGAEFAELLEIGRELLEFPMGLADRNFYLIAYSPDFFKYHRGYSLDNRGSVPLGLINELLLDENAASIYTERDAYFFPDLPAGGGTLNYNIFKENNLRAWLIASVPRKKVFVGELRLFGHLGQYVGEMYTLHADDVMLQRQNDPIHTMLGRILSGEADASSDEAGEVFQDYGWRHDHSYSVTVLYFSGQAELENEGLYLCQQLENEWPFSSAVLRDGNAVWVVNHSLCQTLKRDMTLRQFLAYAIRELMCHAGISDYFTGLSEIRRFHAQAKYAYRFGQKRDPHFWYFLFTDYVTDYISDKLTSEYGWEELCHKGLLKLIRHDDKNRTEFVKTLMAFIENQYNYSITSEKLYIHRTTLIRRLEKIVSISGIDLTDAKDVLYIQISHFVYADSLSSV